MPLKCQNCGRPVCEHPERRAEADEALLALTRERDDLKREVVELRKGIATAVSTLEMTACAVR